MSTETPHATMDECPRWGLIGCGCRPVTPGGGGLTEAEKKACTCGPNGTIDECAAELRAGGWCPRNAEVRAALAGPNPHPTQDGDPE